MKNEKIMCCDLISGIYHQTMTLTVVLVKWIKQSHHLAEDEELYLCCVSHILHHTLANSVRACVRACGIHPWRQLFILWFQHIHICLSTPFDERSIGRVSQCRRYLVTYTI